MTLVKPVKRGGRSAGNGILFNKKMIVRERGYLRQMRYAEHLMLLRDTLHTEPDYVCGIAAYAGIDLVENQRGNTVGFGYNGLESEHYARKLAAGRDL